MPDLVAEIERLRDAAATVRAGVDRLANAPPCAVPEFVFEMLLSVTHDLGFAVMHLGQALDRAKADAPAGGVEYPTQPE